MRFGNQNLFVSTRYVLYLPHWPDDAMNQCTFYTLHKCRRISFALFFSLHSTLLVHFCMVRSKRHWAEKNPNKTSPNKKEDEAGLTPEAGSIQPIASFGEGGSKVAAADSVPPPSAVPVKPTEVDEMTRKTSSPAAGEKRPAEAEAAAVSDAPSSSAQPVSGERHLPQKKRKVEIGVEADSAGAVTAAGVKAPTAAAPSASSAVGSAAKKDGVHQQSDGKWSAAVMHTDGQLYGVGASFDTEELATLALGAFRSILFNESRAAGGKISEAMVKQAREMARHAALAKGRSTSSGQKQK